MPLLAFHDVAAREHEVVEDRLGIGPLPEQVIALEERIVTVAGVRDDERLRRHRVLFHQVGDTGLGVDDDLVRESLHAAPVRLLVADELLAVRPVRIADRQTARCVGVEHLLGGDHLDLVRIGVELVLGGDFRDRAVVTLEQVEVPVGAVRDWRHCLGLIASQPACERSRVGLAQLARRRALRALASLRFARSAHCVSLRNSSRNTG